MQTLQVLIDTLPQIGIVEWIGLRPERGALIAVVDSVEAQAGRGLVGDRYTKQDGKRQVTLIQAEHLDAIGSMLGGVAVEPADIRRNIVVRGINLLALKDKLFKVGDALFEYTGQCHPCSRMESALGPGGYNALRGHGGITSRVVKSGVIRSGDPVSALPRNPD